MNLPMHTFPLQRPANDPSPPAPLREAEGWIDLPETPESDCPPLDYDVDLIAPPERAMGWQAWAFAGIALAMIAFGVWGQWQMLTGAG